MVQVTKAKVQYRRKQWKQLIIECQQSGLPIRTWCTQHGFREQTYYYYLKKIREEELLKLPVSAILTEETVEINEGTSQQTIQAVLLALQSVC